MAKRLYSEVVSGSESSDDERRDSASYPQLHWLEMYQTEDEDAALQKAINLSKLI